VRRLILDAEDLESRATLPRLLFQSRWRREKDRHLFADIRGFTRFARVCLLTDVIYVLNRYFMT